jgi:hypothetical protein
MHSSRIRVGDYPHDGVKSPQCGSPAPVRDALANPRRHITPFRLYPPPFGKGTRWRTNPRPAGRQADRTHDVLEGRPGNPHRRGPSYCRRERRTAEMATKRHLRRPRLEPSSMRRSLAFYDPSRAAFDRPGSGRLNAPSLAQLRFSSRRASLASSAPISPLRAGLTA